MKKFYFAVLLMTTLGTSYSQDKFWNNFKAGATIGSQFSSLQPSLESNESITNQPGLVIGAQFLYKFSDLFTLESGILRNNLSFDTKTSFQVGELTFRNKKTINLTYLSIPLQARWFIKNDRLDVFAITGIATNVLVKDQQFTTDYSGNTYQFEETDYQSKNLATNLTIGVGINYNLSYRASFGLSANYSIWSKSALKNMKSIHSFSLLPTLYYQF